MAALQINSPHLPPVPREELRLSKKTLVRLKRELGNTSPQDNFSQWAKLDRQHNKAMSEYQKLGMIISGHS